MVKAKSALFAIWIVNMECNCQYGCHTVDMKCTFWSRDLQDSASCLLHKPEQAAFCSPACLECQWEVLAARYGFQIHSEVVTPL
jgi:hypothetical protein